MSLIFPEFPYLSIKHFTPPPVYFCQHFFHIYPDLFFNANSVVQCFRLIINKFLSFISRGGKQEKTMSVVSGRQSQSKKKRRSYTPALLFFTISLLPTSGYFLYLHQFQIHTPSHRTQYHLRRCTIRHPAQVQWKYSGLSLPAPSQEQYSELLPE